MEDNYATAQLKSVKSDIVSKHKKYKTPGKIPPNSWEVKNVCYLEIQFIKKRILIPRYMIVVLDT